MPITPGIRIGPYEIIAPLGAGGMGEVYRARDTKLNRDAAIKILPQVFAADQDRVARFEREAQSLASVNHPNIAQVFGVIELPSDGSGQTLALAMEFVDGEDLAQRLSRGPLALDDAVAIAQQLAAALEAAHERGIVHRDLKPGNVKVRPDGTVKLLDFGLAKAIAPAVSEISPPFSPTLTSPAVTQLGVLLGTAAYMSPEQAKGKLVDRRTDVWAFGCVLYEMLVGVAPFAGESISEVIAAVLTKEVKWQALPRGTPVSVRRLLERCLERDPKRRLRDLGDALLELDTRDAASEAMDRPGFSSTRRALAGLVAILAIALVGVAWKWPTASDPPPIRAAIIPDAGFRDFSTLAISPDGSQIAYYRDRPIGGGDLFVRKLDGFTERLLVKQPVALHPFFSPDATELAYTSNEQRAIVKVPISGGAPVEVVRVADAYPALWLEDGAIVVTTAHVDGRIERGLSLVPPGGGPPVPLTVLKPGEELHMTPAALPGRRIVFTVFGAGRHQLALADLDKPGEHHLLPFAIDASTPKYTASGHLLYFQPAEQQVLAVPFDSARGEPTGKPVTVLTNVHRGIDTIGSFDVSREGHLFYTPQGDGQYDGRFFRLTWAGANAAVITDERASWAQPRLSPDGRRLVVRQTATPNCTLWLYDLERGSRTRLLATDPHDPVWHPAGRRVLFGALDKSGIRRVFSLNVNGTDPAVPTETGYAEIEAPRSVSPDGRWLAVSRPTPKTGSDLWVVPLAGGAARRFAASEYAEDHAAFSPDGQWIAYTSNQSGRDEVYVRPWPAADEQYQVSTAGGTGAVWSGDGRRLAYSDGRRVVAVDITVNPVAAVRVRVGTPQTITDGRGVLQRVGNYDLARDGKRLVIVEGSSDDVRVTRELRVIFNWVEDLKRRVPAR